MPSYKLNLYTPRSGNVQPERMVQIDRRNLHALSQKICTDKRCANPTLTLRILLHAFAEIDAKGNMGMSAGKLAEQWGIHVEALDGCIGYLQEINVLQEKQ